MRSDEPGWAILSYQERQERDLILNAEKRLQQQRYKAEYTQAQKRQSHAYRDAALTAMVGTNSNCVCDGWCAPPLRLSCNTPPLPDCPSCSVRDELFMRYVCDQVHGFWRR